MQWQTAPASPTTLTDASTRRTHARPSHGTSSEDRARLRHVFFICLNKGPRRPRTIELRDIKVTSSRWEMPGSEGREDRVLKMLRNLCAPLNRYNTIQQPHEAEIGLVVNVGSKIASCFSAGLNIQLTGSRWSF